MSMQSFCFPNNLNDTDVDVEALTLLKERFRNAQVFFCILGIAGNLLNLRTLQCSSLQTVPFMYIRALAVFDLIALSGILFHVFFIKYTDVMAVMAYRAYFEAFFINTFLLSGLYCAFMLTLERYMLITRPHLCRRTDPRRWATLKIVVACLAALVLHSPMMLQSTVHVDEHGILTIVNNKDVLCREPWFTMFYVYKLGRECLRFICVVVMSVLNAVIARNLQIAKKNRRQLLNKPHPLPHRNSVFSNMEAMQRKEFASLLKSFTEKKLTVLMLVICIIFIVGNIPQVFVMVLQNEATEQMHGFQVFRNTANLLEVVHHCLNFYVFCMASSEYTRAFLLNCLCLRNIVVLCPGCASFLSRRKTSSMCGLSTNNSLVCGMIREYSSMEEFQAVAQPRKWRSESSAPLAQHQETAFLDPSLTDPLTVTSFRTRKGILRDSSRKCLTIVNAAALESDLGTPPYADDWEPAIL